MSEEPLQFDGPANWHCFGTPYVVLTHVGIKEEGKVYPGPMCDTEQEAKDLYAERLREFTEGAQQIAWRKRPHTKSDKGKWVASSRLAIWR